MKNRKLVLGLLCLTANATWLVETAQADRRTGLGGNLLIKDPDDVFPFPQYTVLHRNMIRLDYGVNASQGNGVLTLGNEKHAFGVALHRGDLLSPDFVRFNSEIAWLAGVGDPFQVAPATGAFAGPAAVGAPAAAVLPATVFDVMYGRAVGENAFGLRLGMGRGVQAVNFDGNTEKGQQTFIAAQAGYSLLPQQGLRLDLSGNVVVGFANSSTVDPIDGDEQDVNSGLRIRAGLLSRGYIPVNDVVDIGFLGNLSFTNESFTDKEAGPDIKSNDFSVGLMGGIGPVINLERAKIAAYGGFTGLVGKNDPNTDADDDAVKRLGFAVPMVNMAAEVQVLDWLYVRTGAQYSWDIARARDTLEESTKARATAGSFAWTTGLGIAKNNFAFDMVIKDGFLLNGPSFIGGANTNGFLAIASLTYKFGDIFSGSSNQVEAAPAEPVPLEVPAEPAPVPEYAPPPPPPPPVEGSTDGTINGGANMAPAAPSGGVNVGGSVGGTLGTP